MMQHKPKIPFTGFHSYHLVHSLHMNSQINVTYIFGYNHTILEPVTIQAPRPAFSRYLYVLNNPFHPNLEKCRVKQLCTDSKKSSMSCCISASLGFRGHSSSPPLTSLTENTKQQQTSNLMAQIPTELGQAKQLMVLNTLGRQNNFNLYQA